MKTVTVGVFPAEQFVQHQRMLEGLGELYSIQFVPRETWDWNGCAAALLFGVTRVDAVRARSLGLRCLAFLEEQEMPVRSPDAPVRLASTPNLTQCFRGRMLPDSTIRHVSTLKPGNREEVVASKGEDVLWIHMADAASSLDLVATSCPHLARDKYLFQLFQRDNCIQLLPLFHFLRELSIWQPPPLRACFMFDDPNLHWKSYGYIDFEALARHAAHHNYHVCFASVPLDGWYSHEPTTEVFRKNKTQLSLAVHGNNHTGAELAQPYSDADRLSLGVQALRRIGRFEAKSGLEVARVMVAPHGACSEMMARSLLRAGFEAACISRQSLMKYNRQKDWGVTIGLNLAEFVGDGFPVISRFGLSRHREVDFFMAALLGKPLILDGHHGDLAGGLQLLRELADLVNSFGHVQWMDMDSIARSNYYTFRDKDVLHVRMHARVIQLQIPEGVKRIAVERTWLNEHDGELLEWRERTIPIRGMHKDPRNPILVREGTEIEIASVSLDAVKPETVELPRTPVWAIARRVYCEARDRLKPAGDRIRAPRMRRTGHANPNHKD